MLGPAPPPEDPRGESLSRGRARPARRDGRGRRRIRAGGRIRERGNGRVHARRRRVLLPRAERAHAGRASRHRARHRSSTSSRSSCASPRASRSRSRRGAQGHAVEVRLYAEHPRTFLPRPGTSPPAAARGDPRRPGRRGGRRHPGRLRPLDREADRPRGDAGGRARHALSRAARDAVRGMTTNLGFLRWLVAHPAVRAGETTTAFLAEHPPLSLPTQRLRPLARLVAAQGKGAAPRARRRRRSRAPATADGARRAQHPGRADARCGHKRARLRRRAGRSAAAARRPRGDEDGDAARFPLRGGRKRVHVAEGERVDGGAFLVELEE